MNDIALYILKKYGLLLTNEEVNIVIQWYKDRSSVLLNEEVLESELAKFLYEKFNDRPIKILAEDTSHMKYLLTLLKENKSNKK